MNLNVIKIEIINNYLKENKLSKTAFCRTCNIGYDTLNRILENKNFRLSALFKIAKVIDIKIDELFND